MTAGACVGEVPGAAVSLCLLAASCFGCGEKTFRPRFLLPAFIPCHFLV